MPSKGIKCFTYINAPNISIDFSVPKQSITKNEQKQYTYDHLEVESSNLPRFKVTGRFEFKVRRDDHDLTCQWVDVNSLTGNLEDGTMKDMQQTPSIFVEDLAICYGFYDAGPGIAGLPKQHICYVTVTQSAENWMRDVLPQDQEISNKRFNRLVLPSAHDIGMNSLNTTMTMLKNAGTGIIKEVLGRSLPHAFDALNKLSDSAINHIAPDIIRALAITQKDSLDAILRLGARYFEFRPAKCHRQMQRVSPLDDTWYFQHGAIPGLAYREFLSGVVDFLTQHSDEVVVVHNRWDGVPGDCPRPSNDELRAVLDDVLRDKDLSVGDENDMQQKTIRELRSERKRLIVLQNARQVSNYDDAANATLDGESMVRKLEEMQASPPSGFAVLLLQCQATSTNIRDVIIASVVDSDVSTSPILATKAVCDSKILPLLRGDCGKNLTREEGVAVLLNDFFDGATADVAMDLCRERLK